MRASPPSPPFSEPPPWLDEALAALSRADPRLVAVLSPGQPLPWRRGPGGFQGLLRAVIGQVISDRAAEVLWRRVSDLPGATEPAGLLALGSAPLLAAGLSRPKAAHALSLARSVAEGRLRLDDLPAMDDEAAVAHLTAVPGIGPWTARVHLVLGEDRPDVFPEGDLALAASLAALRGLPARPSPARLAAEARAWAPWRSLAARLLWHRLHLARAARPPGRLAGTPPG